MFCNLEQKTSFNLNCEFENNTRLKRSKVKILGVVDTGSEVVQRRLVRSYVHRQNRTITEQALTDLNRMNIPWYIIVLGNDSTRHD